MAFHRHLRVQNGRRLLTLGMTLGNVYRLKERYPVLIEGDGIRLAIARPHHYDPPSGFVSIMFDAQTMERLLTEGRVEFSLTGLSVVCVFGVFPADAAEAVQRVLGPDVAFVAALLPEPDDPAEAAE